jgi:hypothetical protein
MWKLILLGGYVAFLRPVLPVGVAHRDYASRLAWIACNSFLDMKLNPLVHFYAVKRGIRSSSAVVRVVDFAASASQHIFLPL